MQITEIIQAVQDNIAAVTAAIIAIKGTIAVLALSLWGTSEILAEIPAIKANSVFQIIRNILSKAKETK